MYVVLDLFSYIDLVVGDSVVYGIVIVKKILWYLFGRFLIVFVEKRLMGIYMFVLILVKLLIKFLWF